MLIHPNINTLNNMTIASNKHGYVSMEPYSNGRVRLVAVSHSGNISTAPFFVSCRNQQAIVDEATRLLEVIR